MMRDAELMAMTKTRLTGAMIEREAKSWKSVLELFGGDELL
jgi:hypothetical protein